RDWSSDVCSSDLAAPAIRQATNQGVLAMPAQDLRQKLDHLRSQLEQTPPLDAEERATIQTLIEQLETQLALDSPPPADETLVDGINLAVERFEVSHPTLAGALRNIMQSLVSMGI